MMDKLNEQIGQKSRVVLCFDKSNPADTAVSDEDDTEQHEQFRDMIKSKIKKVRDKVSTTGGRIMALIGQSLTVNDSFVKTA